MQMQLGVEMSVDASQSALPSMSGNASTISSSGAAGAVLAAVAAALSDGPQVDALLNATRLAACAAQGLGSQVCPESASDMVSYTGSGEVAQAAGGTTADSGGGGTVFFGVPVIAGVFVGGFVSATILAVIVWCVCGRSGAVKVAPTSNAAEAPTIVSAHVLHAGGLEPGPQRRLAWT
jgi:hypothetical protein